MQNLFTTDSVITNGICISIEFARRSNYTAPLSQLFMCKFILIRNIAQAENKESGKIKIVFKGYKFSSIIFIGATRRVWAGNKYICLSLLTKGILGETTDLNLFSIVRMNHRPSRTWIKRLTDRGNDSQSINAVWSKFQIVRWIFDYGPT